MAKKYLRKTFQTLDRIVEQREDLEARNAWLNSEAARLRVLNAKLQQQIDAFNAPRVRPVIAARAKLLSAVELLQVTILDVLEEVESRG